MSSLQNEEQARESLGADDNSVNIPTSVSPSSLHAIEECPRRWTLQTAAYKEVWNGRGYPPLVSDSQLRGSVIHRVIERITLALRENGVQDLESDSAIAVLRSLGGYQGLLSEAIATTLNRNENNPRFAPHATRARRALERGLPQMRHEIKALLFSLRLQGNGHGTSQAVADSNDGRLGVGPRTEVMLSVPALRLSGIVDLIDVRSDHVRIIEYKSGDPTPAHVDQVRMYELLWSEDRLRNPAATPVGSITIQYPQSRQEVPPASQTELRAYRCELLKRVDLAFDAISSDRPAAHVNAENCRFCDVRHLCEDYWESTRKTVDLTAEGMADLEIVIGEQHGAHSWSARTERHRGDQFLLTVADTSTILEPLRARERYRLLNVYVQRPSELVEVAQPRVAFTVFSEAFRIDMPARQ